MQALLVLAIANSRFLALPGTSLLYPGRISAWGSPLAAVALAFAWKSLGSARGLRFGLALPVAIFLVALSADRHVRAYQVHACSPEISLETWQALNWAGDHLDPRSTLLARLERKRQRLHPVRVAGLAATRMHLHHLAARCPRRKALNQPPPTHRFLVRGSLQEPIPQGTTIFRNDDVSIVRIESTPVVAIPTSYSPNP